MKPFHENVLIFADLLDAVGEMFYFKIQCLFKIYMLSELQYSVTFDLLYQNIIIFQPKTRSNKSINLFTFKQDVKLKVAQYIAYYILKNWTIQSNIVENETMKKMYASCLGSDLRQRYNEQCKK